MTHHRNSLAPLFPLAPLLLSILGGFSFAHSILIAPGTATYSSALIPVILAPIPLIIPTRTTRTDGVAVTGYLSGYLFRIFGVAALCHVLWDVAERNWTVETNYG
jgi:hypothetical protein